MPKKTRAHNEGTIFERSDGRWVARIVVGTRPDGKPDKRAIYCKTKPEAVAALKELHKEIDQRKGDKRGGELFASYLTRWLAKTKSISVRQNTWELYAGDVKNHIVPALGHIPIADIKTSQIQALLDQLTAQKKSSSVIYRVRFLISSCLRTALPDGIIDRDPTQGTTLLPNTTKKKEVFTPEQADKFVEIVMSSPSRFKDLLRVYWEVGGRISELLGLKQSAIELNAIRIENVIIRTKQGPQNSPPKTKASIRTVFLSDESMEIIKLQPVRGEYVFSTASGKPHNYANFRRQWNSWMVQAFGAKEEPAPPAGEKKKDKAKKPIVTVTPHALRHMQATRLIQAGWAVADVQVRGGWANPSMLMQIYAAHSSEDRQRKLAAAAKIDFGCQFGGQNEKELSAEAENP